MDGCKSFFSSMKIEMPHIPEEEQAKMQAIGKERFGTEEPDSSLYDIQAFVQSFLKDPEKNFILVGADGHGVNSRGLHYYAVEGNIALFVQLDANTDSKKLSGLLGSIEWVFDAMKEAAGKLPKEKKLLVVHSDFTGGGWDWIDTKTHAINKETWHQETADKSVLLDAMEEFDKIADN